MAISGCDDSTRNSCWRWSHGAEGVSEEHERRGCMWSSRHSGLALGLRPVLSREAPGHRGEGEARAAQAEGSGSSSSTSWAAEEGAGRLLEAQKRIPQTAAEQLKEVNDRGAVVAQWGEAGLDSLALLLPSS